MLIYLICGIITILNYFTIPVIFDSLDLIGSIMVATSVNLIVCTVIILLYRILEGLKDANYILNYKISQESKKTKNQ